jgi:hypothetical protein
MTTIAKTMTILCPEWCEQESFDGHELAFDRDGHLCVSHQGPDFGPFYGIGNQVDEDVSAAVVGDDNLSGYVTPAELREFASHALAAAEWLEAQA